METNATKSISDRLYEDFEPYCKWHTKEGQKTLEIDLNGFKKEQLKVQTNNKGILKICGERSLGASSNKWSRFHKEIRISKDSDVNGIQAKFSHDGILSIVIPKREAIQYVKDAALEKYSICGVETKKRTAIKVALGVVAVVAIGTYVARVVVNRHPHGAVSKVDVVNV